MKYPKIITVIVLFFLITSSLLIGMEASSFPIKKSSKAVTQLSDTVFLSGHQLSPCFVDEVEELDQLEKEAFNAHYNAQCHHNKCNQLGNYISIQVAKEQCEYSKSLRELMSHYDLGYNKCHDMLQRAESQQEISNIEVELVLLKNRHNHYSEIYALQLKLLELYPQSYECLKDASTLLSHAQLYHHRVKNAISILEKDKEISAENIQCTSFIKQLVAIYQLIKDIEKNQENNPQKL